MYVRTGTYGTYRILFSHSSVDGCLGCVRLPGVLDVVKNAAKKTGVQIYVRLPAFNSFGKNPRRGTAGPYGHCRLTFPRKLRTAFHGSSTVSLPSAPRPDPSFSTSSPALVALHLFGVFCPFMNGVFLCCCRSSLYILGVNLLSEIGFANAFAHSVGYLFNLLNNVC